MQISKSLYSKLLNQNVQLERSRDIIKELKSTLKKKLDEKKEELRRLKKDLRKFRNDKKIQNEEEVNNCSSGHCNVRDQAIEIFTWKYIEFRISI